jgi:hypothetical protein
VFIENTVRVEAVNVIELSLGRVTQDFICFRYSLEQIFRLVITRIYVRVIPAREPSKGPLDVVQRCRPPHIEKDVKIVPTRHKNQPD